MKICILTIATSKYIQFVERLLDNIEENFLNGHEIKCLLFTDHELETSDNVKVSQIGHKPWPEPALKKYNYINSESEYLKDFDYLYLFDADVGIVDTVGEEVLQDLVGVLHPYKFFEDNKKFGKMYTVNHFLAEKVPRRTIYSILSRFEYSPAQRKSGSDRTRQKLRQRKVNQIIKDFNHKAARSHRQSARKFNVSQQIISQVLKKKTK